MPLVQSYRPRDDYFHGDGKSSYGRNNSMGMRTTTAATNYSWNYDGHPYNLNFSIKNNGFSGDLTQNLILDGPSYDRVLPDAVPPSKRRKVSDFYCESNGRPYQQQFLSENGLENHSNLWQYVPSQFFNAYSNGPLARDNSSAVVAATRCNGASTYASTTSKRDRSNFGDDDEVLFMSRDEIERCSPSRKDGIDVLYETRLRYSYCAFLQNLGVRLDL